MRINLPAVVALAGIGVLFSDSSALAKPPLGAEMLTVQDPQYLRPVKTWWNANRGDYYTTFSSTEETIASGANYAFVRLEGCAYDRELLHAPTSVKLMWHSGREDNASAPTGSQTLTDCTNASYSYASPAIKGYIPTYAPDNGMVSIDTYYHSTYQDHALAADSTTKSALVAAGYSWVRTEGYIHGPSNCD
jgi:hypothetical protein